MGQIFGDWRSKRALNDALPKVREAVLEELHGQGLGRHSVDEVWRLGMEDVDALAQWLGGKDFMMGQEPSSLDATVYCMLAHIQAELESPVADHIHRHDNLLGYCERWRACYYAD